MGISIQIFQLKKDAPIDQRIIERLQEEATSFEEQKIFGTKCYVWWDVDSGTEEIFGYNYDDEDTEDEEIDIGESKLDELEDRGYLWRDILSL